MSIRGEKSAFLRSLVNSTALTTAIHTALDQMETKHTNFTELKIHRQKSLHDYFS